MEKFAGGNINHWDRKATDIITPIIHIYDYISYIRRPSVASVRGFSTVKTPPGVVSMGNWNPYFTPLFYKQDVE